MEYKNTLEIILHDIKDIETSIWDLKKTDNPPLLEIDRALLKLINLYDLLSLIKNDLENKHHKSSLDLKNKMARENVARDVQPGTGSAAVDPGQGHNDGQEPVKDDTPAGKKLNTKGAIEDREKGPSVIGEKFSVSGKFMNESLQQNRRKDISSLMQNKPLVNIESAIGINDKFLFVRDLFNGDMQLYLKTLERLNKAQDFNEAFGIVNDEFEWDMDGYPAQKLLELVRRKFIVNKNG